jgi:hypothetical protein
MSSYCHPKKRHGQTPTYMHCQPSPQVVQVTLKNKLSVRQNQHTTCLHIKPLVNHQYPITWMPHWVFTHNEKNITCRYVILKNFYNCV